MQAGLRLCCSQTPEDRFFSLRGLFYFSKKKVHEEAEEDDDEEEEDEDEEEETDEEEDDEEEEESEEEEEEDEKEVTTTVCTYVQTGPLSSVGNVSGNRYESDCRSRGRQFDPCLVPYFRGD